MSRLHIEKASRDRTFSTRENTRTPFASSRCTMFRIGRSPSPNFWRNIRAAASGSEYSRNSNRQAGGRLNRSSTQSSSKNANAPAANAASRSRAGMVLNDRKLTASATGSSTSAPKKKEMGNCSASDKAARLSSGGSTSPISYRMIVFWSTFSARASAFLVNLRRRRASVSRAGLNIFGLLPSNFDFELWTTVVLGDVAEVNFVPIAFAENNDFLKVIGEKSVGELI